MVKAAEKMLFSSDLPANSLLASFVSNARKRMETLVNEGAASHGQDEKEKSTRVNAAIVHLVNQETNLSAAEKEAYAGFLRKDYFTRDDLSELERFYADGGAWDRLSEKGKEQMGIRLEEGIRRGEIEFSELSPNMQKKHSDWIYGQLSRGKDAGGKFASMSEEDRVAFMREHEAGNYGAAREIFSGKGSFDSQQVESQAASDRRIEAATPDAEGSKKSDSQKTGGEKATDTGTELLASIGKNPTELDTALSGGSIERS